MSIGKVIERGRKMFLNLKADFKRYCGEDNAKSYFYLFFEQGIWAIVFYRLGCWLRSIPIPVINILFKIMAFLLFKLSEVLFGISLPVSAKIGKGFYIGHFGPIILHSDVVIGELCSVGPGVVIGTRGLGKKGVPSLGNNVYVGVGAKLLGSIKIGNNVRIGANAVVVEDVPDGATVVGIPAKIIVKSI
jgi:serine O-acetyltransferase